MSSTTSPLVNLAQSYIYESCPTLEQERQDQALVVIENFIQNMTNYDLASKRIKEIIGTSSPLDKIVNILQVGDEPLPPSSSLNQINNNGTKLVNKNILTPSKNNKRKLISWTQTEDLRLLAGIHKYGLENWISISKFVGNSRTRAQCSQRWNRGLDPHLRKCRWSQVEEERLTELIKKFGLKAWTQIAQNLGNRSDVQCRYHFNQMRKINSNLIFINSPNSGYLDESLIKSDITTKKAKLNSKCMKSNSLPIPAMPVSTIPCVSVAHPEITLSSNATKGSNNSEELTNIFETLNFGDPWELASSVNDINDELFLALEQKQIHLTSDSFLQFQENYIF